MPVQSTDDFFGPIPTLPQLLKQLNLSLGWRPKDMARFMHKDAGEISKLLNGKIKPHRETLEYYAQQYRNAGLEGVTVDILVEARDRGGRVEVTPYDIPAHWLRLVQTILTFDQDFQDAMFRLYSSQLQEVSRLSFRNRPVTPAPPPAEDDDGEDDYIINMTLD